MSDDRELVMPFVAVATKGGPYDDEAYAAGYEMGRLDVTLERLAGANADPILITTIQADNREQADLIAMRHGFIAETALADVDGWAHLRVRPAATEDV